MKSFNHQSNRLQLYHLEKMLKNSVELAFKSLSSDIGDHLFDFEKLQIIFQSASDNYSEEVMDNLATKLDELFLNQMHILMNKVQEEVNQSTNLQKISHNQKKT